MAESRQVRRAQERAGRKAEERVPNNIFARTPWLTPTDGPEIANDLVDLNPGKKCGAAVPVGALDCPKCHAFVRGNPGHKSRKGDAAASSSFNNTTCWTSRDRRQRP